MKKKIIALVALFLLSAGCNPFSTSSGIVGVLKTIDGGATWLPANTIANSESSLSGVSVTEMSFSPANREHIFLGTINNGIWKSIDSASSWSQILAKFTVYDFFIDSQNPEIIFASGLYNSHGKIIRTNDGGKTWEEIYNEASVNNAVNTITTNPSVPGELYAALNSGTVIKSVDNGTTWFVIQQYKEQVFKMRYSRLNNSLYMLLRYKGVLRSMDQGKTWSDITTQLTSRPTYSLESFTSSTVDQFIKMSLDDQISGVIFLTSPKGLYKSTNDGTSWERLVIPVKSTAQTPRAIASSKGGMLAYTSIGGTIFKTLDGGKSWQTQGLPTNSAVNKILIDPQLPQITYAGLLEQ